MIGLKAKNNWIFVTAKAAGATLFLMLVLFANLPSIAQSTPGAPGSTLMGISSALRNQEFTKALELATEALHVNSRDYRVWTLQGLAYVGLNNVGRDRVPGTRLFEVSPALRPGRAGDRDTTTGAR